MATQPATEAPTALAIIKHQIFAPETTAQFRMALPAHIPVERFQRVALTAITNNPDLLRADRRSLFTACGKAAQDGLLPDGREAALVMFGQQAQYMPMVAGVLKKVRNSGELAAISANVVYARDRFTMKLGDSEELVHEPPPLGEERGEPVGAYAVATLKNGEKMREIMSKKDIEKVRAVSRAKNNGPWVQWWDEMARKTVIRRLAKRLPMSTDRDEELRRIIERDDEAVQLEAAAATDAPAARLTAALAGPAQFDQNTGELVADDPLAAEPGADNPAGGDDHRDASSEMPEEPASPPASAPIRYRWIAANGREATFGTVTAMLNAILPLIVKSTPAQARASRERNAAIMAELAEAGHGDDAVALSAALAQREGA